MIKVPEHTANYLLGVIEMEERMLRGGPVFGIVDDTNAMKAAERRGFAEFVPREGWRLTPACYDWAKQYQRRHLTLLPGGKSE